MEQSRQNPFKLLSTLPPVIDLRDVQIATGKDRKAAYNAMSRWTAGGYVLPFASGVYFNLVREPDSPSKRAAEAADRAAPVPKALAGASALSESGWTTQMPREMEIVVATDRKVKSFKKMEGFCAEARTATWFSRVMPYLVIASGGLPALPGPMALVDAIMARHAFNALSADERRLRRREGDVIWHPDPDDICLPPDIDADEARYLVEEACRIMEADAELVEEYLDQIPDIGERDKSDKNRGMAP